MGRKGESVPCGKETSTRRLIEQDVKGQVPAVGVQGLCAEEEVILLSRILRRQFMRLREDCVEVEVLLQTQPQKTVVVNARVRDVRVGGEVSIGGGSMDKKSDKTTRTVWSEISGPSPEVGVQGRSSRAFTPFPPSTRSAWPNLPNQHTTKH